MGDGNLHDGHRERLKERFVKDGLDSFQDHEVLEILLFYARKRCNTNDIAHRLIKTFGSLHGVFDASVDDLKKVDGVGEHSAILINLISPIFRRYLSSKADQNKRKPLTKAEDTKKFLRKEYEDFATANLTGYSKEVFIVLCLDNSNRVNNTCIVARGDPSEANVNPRELVEILLRNNSTNIVMAHNHPGGMAFPSDADIDFTKYIVNLLEDLHINVRDHIIVSETNAFSMASNPVLSPIFKSNFPES